MGGRRVIFLNIISWRRDKKSKSRPATVPHCIGRRCSADPIWCYLLGRNKTGITQSALRGRKLMERNFFFSKMTKREGEIITCLLLSQCSRLVRAPNATQSGAWSRSGSRPWSDRRCSPLASSTIARTSWTTGTRSHRSESRCLQQKHINSIRGKIIIFKWINENAPSAGTEGSAV